MDGDADVSTSVGPSKLNSEKDLFVGHGYTLYQPTLVQSSNTRPFNQFMDDQSGRENILYTN